MHKLGAQTEEIQEIKVYPDLSKGLIGDRRKKLILN